MLSQIAQKRNQFAASRHDVCSHNSIIIAPKPLGDKGWKIEPFSTGRYALSNEAWGYVLPGFSRHEAQRAAELLGDASRWRDHGSAFELVEACWEMIGGAE